MLDINDRSDFARLVDKNRENVESYKADMVKALQSNDSGDSSFHSLNRHLQKIQEAELRVDMFNWIAQLSRGFDEAGKSDVEFWNQVKESLVQILVAGPDDAWSGYDNDARRHAFDVNRKLAGDLIRHADYQLRTL